MSESQQMTRVFRITPEGQWEVGLDGKHTPFTWRVGVFDPVRIQEVEDQLCLQGTPWAELLGRLHVAYSYYANREVRKGRSLLAECFMPLLPIDFFDTGCGIIRDHKAALRHVLDSSWVAMGQMDKTVQGRFQPDASWRAFADKITPYGELDRAQQAAIVAMRGVLEFDTDLLRKAIALNPKEGEWHHLLGFLLAEQRGEGQFNPSPPTPEELSSLRRGLKLRVTPETMTQLARGVLDAGPAGVVEALALMEKAMERFPNDVHVLWTFSHLSPRLFGSRARAIPAGRSRRELLKRCLALLGGRSAFALQVMANELMSASLKERNGRKKMLAEADCYSAQACAVNRVAARAALGTIRFADEL